MKIVNQIKIGKLTAIISFLIGTTIFLLYYFTENDHLFLIGYFYIIFVGIINLGVLMWLDTKSTNDLNLKKKLSQAKKLILLNIPIVATYFIGIITLLSYMKITFVNTTNLEISNIRIIGCEEKEISKMLPNERITKWILINGDCSIGIKYNENGIEKEEIVVHYVSGLMGQRYKYRISEDDGKF